MRRIVGVTAALAALALVAGGWWLRARALTRPVDLRTLTAADWRDDLHQLAKELPARHANAFHRITRAQFLEQVARIDSAVPTLQPSDVPVDFEKLTAVIGDAHTFVSLPADQHFYPFDIYYFGDVPRVVRTAPEYPQLLGTRLVAIAGVDMDDVEARLRQVLTQGENASYYRAHYPWFLSLEVLHALGIVRGSGPANFTFLRDDGTTLSLPLPANASPPPRWLHAYGGRPPLYIAHADDDFWFTELPDSHLIYVIFNSYNDLRTHADRLFRFLDGHAGDALVLDLRGNGGGDYLLGHKYLIAPIVARPSLNRPDRLFVVTGRFTFSAAMNNAAEFRTETHATLVGEPPGEVPNSYQERRSFRLAHSHLLVNYSTRYYRFLPTDAAALVPDLEVDPDWPSYLAGRDPALERIVSLVQHRSNTVFGVSSPP